METATYTTRPAAKDKNHGTFFYTSCCNSIIYSVKGKMSYDGALCPSCYYNYKKVVLKFAGGSDWRDELKKQ